MTAIVLINTSIGALMIVIGFLVKAYPNLIAGYNTMRKERKKDVDISGLSSMMKTGFIIMGLAIIFGFPLFIWLGYPGIAQAVMAVCLFGGTIVILILAQTYDPSVSNFKSNGFWIAIGALIVIAGITIGFLIYASKTHTIQYHNDGIEITGLYGILVNNENIEKVTLMNERPNIELRTNGFSMGKVKKGKFRLRDVGECSLFLQSNDGPFINLGCKNESLLILNFKSEDETITNFRKIEALLDSRENKK